MKPSEIKRHRKESILRELIPEALSQLDNDQINGLTVTEVIVSRGADDADVYIDPLFFTPEEKKEILVQLRKASHLLESYCMQSEGWYKSPKLHFHFDEQLEKASRIEKIFKQIEKEKSQ